MKIDNAAPKTNIESKNNQSNSKVAFKGNPKSFSELAKDEFKKMFTLDRPGPMTRKLFITNAFVFLLGTRLVTSRDKDEKREILIRDVPSIVTAVLGVPIIGNFFAGKLQERSGFAIMRTDKNPEKSDLMKWIHEKRGIAEGEKMPKPKSSPLSYGEIDSLYKYEESISSGLSGFSKRLCELTDSVDLKKVYSTLSDKIKQGIEKINPKDNIALIDALELETHKDLKGEILNALKDGKNAALKKAEFLKTVPIMIGFGITLVLLGLIIPKTNIFITETVNKKRKNKNASNESSDSKNVGQNLQPNQTLPIKEYKKAFEKFTNN